MACSTLPVGSRPQVQTKKHRDDLDTLFCGPTPQKGPNDSSLVIYPGQALDLSSELRAGATSDNEAVVIPSGLGSLWEGKI